MKKIIGFFLFSIAISTNATARDYKFFLECGAKDYRYYFIGRDIGSEIIFAPREFPIKSAGGESISLKLIRESNSDYMYEYHFTIDEKNYKREYVLDRSSLVLTINNYELFLNRKILQNTSGSDSCALPDNPESVFVKALNLKSANKNQGKNKI